MVNLASQLEFIAALQAVDSDLFEIFSWKEIFPTAIKKIEEKEKALEFEIKSSEEKLSKTKKNIEEEKNSIKSRRAKLAKYEAQKEVVSNSKEYSYIIKAIEVESLEIQIHEKNIKNHVDSLEIIEEKIKFSKEELLKSSSSRQVMSSDINSIIEKNKKKEDELVSKRNSILPQIDRNILEKYENLRKVRKNGLGASFINRGACGCCFMLVPIQTQIEIILKENPEELRRCDHCGGFFLGISSDDEHNLINNLNKEPEIDFDSLEEKDGSFLDKE